jgi:hypothetical protein
MALLERCGLLTEALAEYAPSPLAVRPSTPNQRGDMLALEMGLRAASRLTPHRLAQFKSNIEKLVARNPSRYVREWKRAIEEGPDAVGYLLTDCSDRRQVLRSVIYFRPFVSKEDRDALFRADAADVRKRNSVER